MNDTSYKIFAFLLFCVGLLLQIILLITINKIFDLHMLLKTQLLLPLVIDLALVAMCKANSDKEE